MINKYIDPIGYCGTGNNIKWCDRISGRKRCDFCYHYANFSDWSKKWTFYYLMRWKTGYYYEDYAHYKIYYKNRYLIEPNKYKNTGLKENELKSILRKGCKNNKRCKCMNILQRGFWYCPDCYSILNQLATMEKKHIHDLMITDRSELKGQVLLFRLSGLIQF